MGNPYDSLEWDEDDLVVVLKNREIERYTPEDLKEIIEDYPEDFIDDE